MSMKYGSLKNLETTVGWETGGERTSSTRIVTTIKQTVTVTVLAFDYSFGWNTKGL
jgi:hypothetical protein